MKKIFLALFLSLSANILQASEMKLNTSTKLVTTSLYLWSSTVRDSIQAEVHFTIKKNWHLYWINPGDAGYPPKITIAIENKDAFEVSSFRFPTPIKFIGAGVVAYGYKDDVTLLATIRLKKNISSDTKLQIKINWLVCEDVCIPQDTMIQFTLNDVEQKPSRNYFNIVKNLPSKLPPSEVKNVNIEETKNKRIVTLEFTENIDEFFPNEISNFIIDYSSITIRKNKISFSVNESSAGKKIEMLKGIVVIQGKGYDIAYFLHVKPPSKESDPSIWFLLFFAFIGGMILNIMPCVLPILSIKILSLSTLSQQSKKKKLQHGLWFSLGVLLSFWILAAIVIVLKQVGLKIGWGFQFQFPEFVIVLLAVIWLFGLNMVGVFEVLSISISSKITKLLSENSSIGSFVNGIMATILSTPCSAPFLGTAIGFAFSQSNIVILFVFTIIAMGLAFPYFLASINTRLLSFLPKPGDWMYKFRQAMGFLLFATAIWLISILSSQLGSDGAIASLEFILGLSIIAWLFGAFINLNSTASQKILIWIISLAILGGSYYYSFSDVLHNNKINNAEPSKEDSWIPFSEKVINNYVKQGRIVFVDFTAAWCLTCKVNEKSVLASDNVKKVMNKLNVIMMKGDWTGYNEDITNFLLRYGKAGVPFYLVYSPNGNSPILLPELLTESIVLDALHQANDGVK